MASSGWDSWGLGFSNASLVCTRFLYDDSLHVVHRHARLPRRRNRCCQPAPPDIRACLHVCSLPCCARQRVCVTCQ